MDRSVRIRVAVAIEPPWLLVPGVESRPVDQARIDEEDDRFADLEQVQPLQAPIPRGGIATSGTDTGGGGGGGGSPSPSGGPSLPLPGGLFRAMSGCCEE